MASHVTQVPAGNFLVQQMPVNSKILQLNKEPGMYIETICKVVSEEKDYRGIHLDELMNNVE